MFTYDFLYPRPGLAADICVVHRYDVLLITRKDNNLLALPGGFVNKNETLLEAAKRELQEETGLSPMDYQVRTPLEFVKLFDKPKRDPRGWMISGLHFLELDGSINKKHFQVKAADDAKTVLWMNIGDILDLEEGYGFAFDHREMIKTIWNTKFTNR